MKKGLHVNVKRVQRNKRDGLTGDDALPTVHVWWYLEDGTIHKSQFAHHVHLGGPSDMRYNFDKQFVELTTDGKVRLDGVWVD